NGGGREAHGMENPRRTYAAGLRARPALLVRGSSRRITIAGSENSDHVLSGNSGHLPVALPGQTIVGDSASDEGKDDRDAQATRDPGPAARRAHVARGGHTERRVRADGAARRRRSGGDDGR